MPQPAPVQQCKRRSLNYIPHSKSPCISTHPLVTAHDKALRGDGLAIANAPHEAVAHDRVLMLACARDSGSESQYIVANAAYTPRPCPALSSDKQTRAPIMVVVVVRLALFSTARTSLCSPSVRAGSSGGPLGAAMPPTGPGGRRPVEHERARQPTRETGSLFRRATFRNAMNRV